MGEGKLRVLRPGRCAKRKRDELVYTDQWDLWLKTFFDDRWPVRIAATSSATAALRERRLESGIGRWSEQHLTPYLFTEFLDLVDRGHHIDVGETLADTLGTLARGQRADPDLASWRRLFMLVGGSPELLTAARDRPDDDESNRLLESQQVLRSDAVERAIYKDIPQSFGVDNPMMLERLLYVLAAQITATPRCSAVSLPSTTRLSSEHCSRTSSQRRSDPSHCTRAYACITGGRASIRSTSCSIIPTDRSRSRSARRPTAAVPE